MRILYLYLVGELGDRIRTMEVLCFLKNIGYEVIAIDIATLVPSVKLKKLWTNLLYTYPIRQITWELLRYQISHFCEKIKPDLIFSVGSPVGWLALPAGKKYSIPCIVDVHGLVGAETAVRNEKDWKLNLQREDETFHESTHLIVVGSLMKDIVSERYDVPKDKITVAYNGTKIRSLRAHYKKPLNVIYAGSFYPFVHDYLDLVKQANSDTIKFYLLGRGSPTSEQRLYKRIHDEKIPITCLGFKPHDKALDIMSNMSVGVMPSDSSIARRIGVPIKVLENMSIGLPVVVSSYMEISNVVKQENCGLVAKSTSDFAEALNKLADENLWQVQSINGVEAVRQKYNWDNVLVPIKDLMEHQL